MPPPEPAPRQTWSVSQRHASAPKAPEEIDLFSTPSTANDGYEKWQAERQSRRKEFEKTWGIRLGRRVRVQLRNERSTREGVIHLIDDLPDQMDPDKRLPLRLRIGDHRFLPNQIESLSVIDT
jgi:hypothetical protein